jgi:2,3,4,5-tetrahydropyridine-2-carboxylate N-succinyltransferase
MDIGGLQTAVDAAWENRTKVSATTKGETRDAVDTALELLDRGAVRVAEKKDGKWSTNQWLKKAVLLSFRLNDSELIPGGGEYPEGRAAWFDKVSSKFAGWNQARFAEAGFRAVPNCVVRKSAYIAPGVVLMPSFVNVGAYVDSGTMVDTWVTVGSCCQVGKNCHISGGVGLGGVLEPLHGRVPAYSVVVSGSMPGKPLPNGEPGPSLYCAVIVKRVDEKTRSKTSINELLRD